MIFNLYLNFVYKTSKINFIEQGKKIDYNNSIIGFWHGESCCNYLICKHFKDKAIDIIVTEDKRGDYISNILEKYKVTPLRVGDGCRAKDKLREIITTAQIPNRIFMVALDGPLGPYHVPKKLAFMLSNKSNKQLGIIRTDVKRKIILKRWDKYIIPLPFNNITFNIEGNDIISNEFLNNFKYIQEMGYTIKG
ncbi:hypothetical protein AN639_01860 [Candidatus Epulonipiscium fishelsonii]|uniref:Uncharacterized protein n=1 Tax=Candidatus Epulonipiscium fishelsonii TaxID=77094 RepID=A0ACC8X8N4_9FIRM|nr:hypothetical protein AN396_10820 [Epulopiscium sp. SCG-B11WGA-EpuloA1]ONI38950.1 hypothetical protein AN639_01860 [Epulopiscium sp. SCG-B05WGA-EpuloA1]